jgi:DNA modification methylase
VTVLHGDCVALMRGMPDCSVDAIVTDPPYELSFMGRKWDGSGIAYSVEMWGEALRVLKPGGHLLAFGGTRTYHRMACAIEDAGFEIRDSLHWTFGSGFPKSLSVHKATLKLVDSRYGTGRCDCVDPGDGLSAGDDAGRKSWADARAARGQGEVSADSSRRAVVSLDAETGDGVLRQLREDGGQAASGRSEVEAPVLLADVRGRGAKASGLGDAALRAGVEEPSGGDSGAGQGVPDVRDNAGGVGSRTPRSPRSSIQIRRDQQAGESGGAVRFVPPSNRVGDGSSAEQVGGERHARRLVLDDNGGRQKPVCWVCSECGLPDEGYLKSLEPLGSALKPAHEPIVVARKPLAGTVAGNVLVWGTGGLNIDGCRVGTDGGWSYPNGRGGQGWHGREGLSGNLSEPMSASAGRWPANVVFDRTAGEALDQQSGVSKDNVAVKRNGVTSNGVTGWGKAAVGTPDAGGYGGSGGASRFFTQADFGPDDWPFVYQAKPSRKERNAGVPEGTSGHPTVKPVALMRHLVRLVTPPGGTVLDPFAGSGTTLVAAVLEGFDAIGCEMTDEYLPIIEGRVAWAQAEAEAREEAAANPEQPTLL